MCHVGDSGAYVINPESITAVTTDHSFAMELVKIGKMTRDEARKNPLRSQLSQSVGLSFYFNPEYSSHELQEEDVKLLYTDGLRDMLSDAEIHDSITRGRAADEICNRLIDAANIAGGADNITVIVVKPEGNDTL